MKLRHKSDPSHRINALEQLVYVQNDTIDALCARVAELQNAAHDHCLSCGAMTPRYGMTLCGTTDCAQRAMA